MVCRVRSSFISRAHFRSVSLPAGKTVEWRKMAEDFADVMSTWFLDFNFLKTVEQRNNCEFFAHLMPIWFVDF